MHYVEVLKLIREAATRRDLINVAQNIQHVGSHAQRDRLELAFKKRFDELKPSR